MSYITGMNLTRTDATPQYRLGTVGQDYTGKLYKYVLHNNGAGNVAPIVGDFAYVYAVSGASAGQITTVTMDLTDTAGIGAGVWQSIPADGEYCWIQTWGPATLTTALLAGADGNALTAVGASTDGTLDVSAAVTDHICAIAIDASAKIVFVTCP
jgi:hypothetical protein